MKLNPLNPYETQEEYKTLFEQAPDAVVAIDEANRIVFWNPKAEEIFGWTAEEVISQPLSQIIIPVTHREAHDKGMKRYLETGEVRVLNRTIEVPAINKEGTEFFIALTIAKTVLKGNTAFLAFIRDVTQQRRNQEELERKTRELEHSNRNLEEFARAASHDLKEPVRKIHVFGNRLKELLVDRLSEKEIDLLARMENATTRMSQLIDDLLTYSQVSRNTQEAEEIPLQTIVQRALEDLELQIEEKKAQVMIKELPVVVGYKRQLQQLFQNLISNALKYTKSDTQPLVSITSALVKGQDVMVSFATAQQNSAYYLLEVKDNGIGFDQENAERIFQLFQRLHGRSEYAGTGIGLAIARRVAENHKGYIWAESQPGIGTTFKVLLPHS